MANLPWARRFYDKLSGYYVYRVVDSTGMVVAWFRSAEQADAVIDLVNKKTGGLKQAEELELTRKALNCAIDFINKSPGDPDVTTKQAIAYADYTFALQELEKWREG